MSHPHAAHTATDAPVNPFDLAAMLKQGTQDLHDRAENHDFQQRFASCRITRTQFGLLLAQILKVHSALEPNLRTLTTRHPIFRDLVAEHHFRYDLIRKDLADLGVRHENVTAARMTFERIGELSEHLSKLEDDAGASPAPRIVANSDVQTTGTPQ